MVALIMRRHRHDRACAVVHQNIVCNPDRQLFAVVRIDRKPPGIDAVLLNLAKIT